MCPICGKYRELTRCVRRMRIAHPTPPRGGDICPIGATFLGFGPTPPHGEDIPHAYPTPEAAENFRPGRRRPAESKPGPAAAAPLASTGTARTRRRPLGDVNSPVPARRRVSGAPRARDALRERRVRSPRTGRLGGGGPGRLRRQRLPSPADAAVVRDNVVGTTALSGAEGTDGGRHNNGVSRWIHSPA